MWLLYNNSPQRQCQLTCLWIMQCSIAMQLLSNVSAYVWGFPERCPTASAVQLIFIILYPTCFVDIEK